MHGHTPPVGRVQSFCTAGLSPGLGRFPPQSSQNSNSRSGDLERGVDRAGGGVRVFRVALARFRPRTGIFYRLHHRESAKRRQFVRVSGDFPGVPRARRGAAPRAGVGHPGCVSDAWHHDRGGSGDDCALSLGTAVVWRISLLYGVQMLRKRDKEVHFEKNPVFRFASTHLPVTNEYRGAHFFLREEGRFLATPLLLVLLIVEITDVTFAVDSIPAIFGITRDSFIVYTSNVFAILGLR